MKLNLDSLKYTRDSHVIDSLKQVINNNNSANSTREIILKFMQPWQTWLIILIIIIIIILFFYRKPIKIYLNTFNRVKFGGMMEFSDRKEKSLTQNKDNLSEAKPPETNGNTNIKIIETQENQSTQNNEENNLWDAYLNLKNNDLSKATKIFDKVQLAIQNDSERAENKAIFIYFKFLTGFPDSLNELKVLSDSPLDNKTKSHVKNLLGDILFRSDIFDQAKQAYEESLKYLENDDRNLDNFLGISNCILKTQTIDSAINYIKLKIQEIKTQKNQAKLFKAIGDIYKNNKNYFECSLAYLRAIEFVPNDIDLLFSLSYNISECGFDTIASYFYDQLLSYKPNYSSALNNMGVAYSRLGLKFKENIFFKQAYDAGNSLAASNLSNRYIFAGLEEDARGILNKASKQENVDPQVWVSLENLNRELKEEKEKFEVLVKDREFHQNFLKLYAKYFFENNIEQIPDVSGEWLYMKEKDTQISYEDKKIIFEFIIDGDKKDKITLHFKNKIGTATWLTANKMFPILSPDKYEGYALYDNSSGTILILAKNRNDTKSCELSKKVIKFLGEGGNNS